DLRVPHFVGLHAAQLLPIIALVGKRRGLAEATRIRLTFVAAVSYLSFYSILLWQALRAQSILRPDSLTLVALAIWVVGALTALWVVGSRRPIVDSRVVAY